MNKTEILEAKLNRANMSEKDFEEAIEYLQIYKPNKFDTANRAILIAAIIAYARPFTNNRGEPGLATHILGANPRKIFSCEELSLHEKIISYRNEAIAHSDYCRRPTRLIKSTDSGFITGSKPFDIQSERINTELIMEICKKMKKYCVEIMFKINRDINLLVEP